VVKRLERILNAVVDGILAFTSTVVRAITAVAAFAMRRGRHREWRREAEQQSESPPPRTDSPER
jgi:hypothetical protein